MEPFIGTIIMFGGNFAPRGWALCNGQLLAINTYSALFSILGTNYGGDGRNTFGLPDLRGRSPIHAGTGDGLTPRQLGVKGGSETNTLNTNQIPSHNHSLNATTNAGTGDNPSGNLLAQYGSSAPPSGPYASGAPNAQMQAQAIGNTGGSQPVDNMAPFQVVNYIIALEGLYPSRN